MRTLKKLICLFVACYGVLVSAPAFSFDILVLADIHFDPYLGCKGESPCALVQALRVEPVSKWPTILAKYDTPTIQYAHDTSYPLLRATLSAALLKANQASFVMVLGDFLGHHYHRKYKKYSYDQSRAGYEAFVNKTFMFLTQQLAAAFPNRDVYCVVGNNDTFGKNYSTRPNGKFLQANASMWSSLIAEGSNKRALQTTFPTGGYYAVDVLNKRVRLILLNSVLFSNHLKRQANQAAAKQELNWLHDQFVMAKAKQQQIILAMHIPTGIDINASRWHLFTLMNLWYQPYIDRFKQELHAFAPNIIGVFSGHLHANWWQPPMAGAPAVSPIFMTTPAFNLYRYSPELNLETSEIYLYPF